MIHSHWLSRGHWGAREQEVSRVWKLLQLTQAGDKGGGNGEKWLERGHISGIELTVLATYTQDRWTQSHTAK